MPDMSTIKKILVVGAGTMGHGIAQSFAQEGFNVELYSRTAETLERAHENALRVACLPRWYDVDTSEDLERLIEQLRSQPDNLAPHTRAFLPSTMQFFEG